MMRILQVVSVMDMGGMENYIMNLYRKMDRTKIQFDFLVHHRRRGYFEDEIETLGGHVYHTSLMDDFNLIRYIHDLDKLFREHAEYRIVHGHLGSTAYFYLGMAAKHGVPTRILHSHCPSHMRSLKGYVKHVLFQFSPIHANVRLACSEAAGKYQFKDKAFEVVPNGIDVNRFRFSNSVRADMRRKLGLDDCFVVGHVGRFYYEKNHEYLLKVFSKLREKEPKVVLMLLGDGALKEQIESQVQALKLEGSVLFMGLIRDCAPYYQAMDAFVLPSLYEALPLTGLEAQCAGLPCLFSETVSPEIKMVERASFLPIAPEDIETWADRLIEIEAKSIARNDVSKRIMQYDVGVNAQKMAARYARLWGKEG